MAIAVVALIVLIPDSDLHRLVAGPKNEEQESKPAGGDSPGNATYVTEDGTLLSDEWAKVGTLPIRNADIGPDGRLVFSSSREATANEDCCGPNRSDLYLAQPDGSDVRPLLTGRIGQLDLAPDWSPHGDTIAFVRRQPSGYGSTGDGVEPGIYRHHLQSGKTTQLARGDFFGALKWSPKGDLIATATSEEMGLRRIVVLLDATTGEVRHRIDEAWTFAWSPDGTQIAVGLAEPSAGPAGPAAVAVYDLKSGSTKRLPNTSTLGTFVNAWGPDGIVARLNRGGGNWVVVLIEPDRSRVQVVRRCSKGGELCSGVKEAFKR